MNPLQILSVLSALTAAVWSVWTWSEDQQKQRQIRRDQEAALYVNPFILSIEELQSRLYSILEEDDLAFYKKEYPNEYEFGSPAAIEILYRLSQYFGWVHRIFRYGPYTKDPRVIELNRQIGETFEDRDKFSGDAFLFSIDERVSLGEAVVRRIGEVTAVLPVFESIPLFQFEEELSDQQSKHAPLFQSRAVCNTLKAIDQADRAEALEGRERLEVLQNLLVDLVAYLENKEGFSVSVGDRRRANLTGDSARQLPNSVLPSAINFIRILHQTRGRIRLKIDRLKTDKVYSDRLQSLLASVESVSNIRISPATSSVIICFSPDISGSEFATRIMKTIEGA
jgi:hypothetical protein